MPSLSANAATVLPPELLKEVQKYWRGALLWIPDPQRQEMNENDERALLLIQAGMTAKEVAEACEMTLKHVYFIARRLPDNFYSRPRR